MLKIFISHSKRNRERAVRLAKALQANNFDVWFDEWDMLVGHNLADQVYNGIKTSNYLAVILTESSVKSRWVKEELDYAKIQELEGEGVTILPLLYEKCDIPDSLRTKYYADFRFFDRGFSQLIRLLNKDVDIREEKNTSDKIAETIVGPLHTCFKLQSLIFYIADLETHSRKTVIEKLKNDVSLLSSLALHYNLDRRCYDWLDSFVDSFSINNIKKLLDLWIKGTALFRGALYFTLPTKARVAFEIGKEWLSNDTAKWRYRGIEAESYWAQGIAKVARELALPPQFHDFLTKNMPVERIMDALYIELNRASEELHLRDFLDRRILAQGVFAGYLSLRIISEIPLPIDSNKETISESFKHSAETIAEFLLANFGAIDEAMSLMDMALVVLSKDYNRDQSDIFSKILEFHKKTYELASMWSDPLPRNSYCLGALLGKLLVFGSQKIDIDFGLIHETEATASALNIAEPFKKRIRSLLDALFYGTRDNIDEKEFNAIVFDICSSSAGWV